jgi:hypothetical protein
MAKAKSRSSKKESITLSRGGFVVLVLFLIAITMLGVYAYMGYGAM